MSGYDRGGPDLTPDPSTQSVNQRRRNQSTIRVTRVTNGYMVTLGDTGETLVATSREQVHDYVDEFFDDLELESGSAVTDRPDRLPSTAEAGRAINRAFNRAFNPISRARQQA